ncbi:ABC transporter permease [Tenggerimyces flavus]|uniref:ABC transporter permease n=1 Tax=Tenggerimyces flavus TaxID=1708749 RepID=A0ABV7YK22_9ACTN|nr:ABC transporter permease [Tenggerimyces flavus]MBM7784176.1 ABC-type nitrate/sulfonate/bicarbonate transport system permease component [Tenggerimyces flavus]
MTLRPHTVLGIAGFGTFLLLLELVPRIGIVSPEFLPPFSDMVVALFQQLLTAEFWLALLDTLKGWFLGLGIAVVLGVVIGVGIGIVPVLRELTASTIEFLRPIPSVALIPLAVLMFDTNLGSVLMLVVYASFWQVLVQTLYGVHDVDPVARETARSFRLGRWSEVRYVVWPSALPYVMTGLRLAASVALILAITAELIIGAPGLGNQIGVAQSGGAIASMYALVLVTGGLGVGVDVLFRRLERWALRWHQSVRREVMA